MKILGISGSIRRDSHNTKVLKYLQKTIPVNHPAVHFEVANISDLPLYNEDIERFGETPEPVTRFRNQVREATALFFSTPEHNYVIPAALKNALDWGSRPYNQNSFEDKPAAVVSASMGYLGGVKAQYSLRLIFVALNIHAIQSRPEVVIPVAHEKLDDDGNIKDQMLRENVDNLVTALIEWTERLTKRSDQPL
jgi:chromate reductase